MNDFQLLIANNNHPIIAYESPRLFIIWDFFTRGVAGNTNRGSITGKIDGNIICRLVAKQISLGVDVLLHIGVPVQVLRYDHQAYSDVDSTREGDQLAGAHL